MKYVVKKFGVLVFMLYLVSFITFIAFSVIPGDSVTTALGTDATEEAIEAIREQMGYHDPVIVRYGRWICGVFRGNLGISTKYHVEVAGLLVDKLPVTIGLTLFAVMLIAVIGIPLGVWLAKTQNRKLQNVISFFTQAFMSIPSFFLGMILTLIFGITLHWFRPGGYISIKDSFAGFVSYLVCPAIAIAIPKISMMAKFTVSSIRREMHLDYVRTAYSKGNTRSQVFRNHILKNSMIPVITFMGMMIADVMTGSIIVEQVFNLPGVGRLLVSSIGNRDLYVVQAIMLYIVTVVIVINFLVDIMYQLIDPRVKMD